MKYIKSLAVVLFLCVSCVVQAQTITATKGTTTIAAFNRFNERATISWTSNATGEVTATITGIQGELLRAAYKPAVGAASPSNAYDLVITDDDGVDVLAGTGANLSNTTATTKSCMATASSSGYVPMAVAGGLTFTLTNAGASNQGTVRLYFRRVTR